MKKTHANLQSYIKTCVKFQKDQPKTVRGVALTRYLLHMHFNRVGDKKKKKVLVKNAKISLNPVTLTFNLLNPKINMDDVLIKNNHHVKYEDSAINGSKDIEQKPILHKRTL